MEKNQLDSSPETQTNPKVSPWEVSFLSHQFWFSCAYALPWLWLQSEVEASICHFFKLSWKQRSMSSWLGIGSTKTSQESLASWSYQFSMGEWRSAERLYKLQVNIPFLVFSVGLDWTSEHFEHFPSLASISLGQTCVGMCASASHESQWSPMSGFKGRI